MSPTPRTDAVSEEWWAATAAGRLLQPHCRTCGAHWFPPLPGCPRCGSQAVELVEASLRASVYSWVVVFRALSPAFADAVPYVVLVVDLDAGGRMFGQLRGHHDDPRLQAGAPVEAVFYEIDRVRLVGFSLIG